MNRETSARNVQGQTGPAVISHATVDRAKALSICGQIERRGGTCWIACRDVALGENYQEAIVQAIRNAQAVVLVFSAAANHSNEIKKELSLASRYHVPVLALRIEDVEPSDAFAYELSTRQWIDAFDQRDGSLDILTARIAQVSGAKDATTEGERRTPLSQSRPFDRRRALIAGSAVLAASAAGLAWFERERGKLPPDVQKLLDDGHAALNQATVDQFAAAVASFRRATQMAPNRAEPWGGLALAYERQAALASSPDDQSLHGRAENARRRALAIDPDNGDALAAGVMALPIFGNWLACERACRAALDRQPQNATLNTHLAFILMQVGRIADAHRLFERAVASNADSVPARTGQVGMLYDLDRIDEAEETGDAVYRTWPRHYAVWFPRIYDLANHGRTADALAMIDDRTNRPIGITEANFENTRHQVVAMQTHSEADIDTAMKSTLDFARVGTGFAENAVMFAGAVGRVDDAYDVLNAYFFDRGFTLPNQRFTAEQGTFTSRRKRWTYILFKRYLRPVRADPRFPALTTALKLDDYWKRSGSRPDYLNWS